MKYLVITSSYPVNDKDSRNTGVFVRDFSRELISQGCDVLILTPDKRGQKELQPQVPVFFFKTLGDTSELVNLSLRNPWDALKLASVIVSGIVSVILVSKKYKPDKILACWVVPSGIFAWFAKKILGISYDVWALGSDIWKINRYPLGKYFLRLVIQNSKNVFANSNIILKRILEYSDRKGIILRTTRNLSSRDSFQPKLDEEKTNFLMISRFHPDKGPDILIEAFSRAIKEVTNIHLYIFGGGLMKEQLRQKILRANTSNYITLGGYLDEQGVASYLDACDCLVVPSRKESMPIVVSEAIQFSKPVIVSNVGDMGRYCEEKKFGIVVEPENPKELAEAIIDFAKAQDRKKYMPYKELINDFDLKQIVSKFSFFQKNK